MRGGFSLADVREMTLAQLKEFSRAVESARRRENCDLLVMLRGSQYDKKDFEKLYKALGG